LVFCVGGMKLTVAAWPTASDAPGLTTLPVDACAEDDDADAELA
jgi:hypothetical protein